MSPMAAYDEQRRRSLRRVLIERVITTRFAVPVGKAVQVSAVNAAVAELLNETLGMTLRREIRAAAASLGYFPGRSNGRDIYRRRRHVCD